jgi:cytochrome c oxidase subunit 3
VIVTGPAPTTTNGHDNGHGHGPVATKDRPAPGAGAFGMGLFLVSLGVLFIAGIVAYAIVRSRAGAWPPPGTPPLPQVLWLSTALIVAGSVAMQWALTCVRANALLRFRIAISLTLALGLAFLASQTAAWIHLVEARSTVRSSLYGYLFYFMTGVHALHVLGGIVPLVVITVNAFYGRYTALSYAAVRFCTMYWHVLGVVWLVLFWMLASSGT